MALLFQTGYLTIKRYDKEENNFHLYYPNYEVESAFLEYLLDDFRTNRSTSTNDYLWQLADALKKKKFSQFFSVLQIFLAGIPYDIQLDYEKYYQTIFYLIVRLVGLKASAEERTNKGRIDSVIELEDSLIIFEFKLDGTAQEALEQIKEKEYAQKYWLEGKEIILAGVNFSKKTRQVSQWKVTDVAGAEIEAFSEKASKEPQEVQKSEKQALLEQAQGIARHLLMQGLPAELVAQSTGLPLEEVQALRE